MEEAIRSMTEGLSKDQMGRIADIMEYCAKYKLGEVTRQQLFDFLIEYKEEEWLLAAEIMNAIKYAA